MPNIKSWPKLLISILLAHSVGYVGTFFTISEIPFWYETLNKPAFSPPNSLFGPVWLILYTLIGVSLYLIWIKSKKGVPFIFWLHLLLNAIWSPIFFGLKNLGLAFFVIILMVSTLIVVINKFRKIDKLASYLLIPYLAWISFAALLNYSIWRLNPSSLVSEISAQGLNYAKAREDYIFSQDTYNKDLFDFNFKKDAYLKNPTLSIKEEARLALYKFVNTRNDFVISYLNMVRAAVTELNGIDSKYKNEIYSLIDNEVTWYTGRKNAYSLSDSLETILEKSKVEDEKFRLGTIPNIHFSLAHHNLGQVINLKNRHLELYEKLKSESQNLVNLGRADSELFDRWFKDIDKELVTLATAENEALSAISLILGIEEYKRERAYKDSVEILEESKSSLFKLNNFIEELENVVESKR